MRLFLMRHGETPWNRRQRCQGVSDVPLSAMGRAQAVALAAALEAEPLIAVYASPLVRALETARAVARLHRLPVVPLPALRELHHGACEGLTPAQLRARFAPLLAAWATAPADVVLPGGESMRQLEARAFPALVELARRHPGDAAVAVVAHNLVNLACLCRALGWPLDRFRELRQDVASLAVLDLDAEGRARVITVNETAHLGYLPRPLPPQRAEPPPAVDGGLPRLFGDLAAPFTYLVLRELSRAGAPRLAWRGVSGTPAEADRVWRAARRLAEAARAPLVVPPSLVDQGPALRLLADAEASAGVGLVLAAKLAERRFTEGADLGDPRLLVETAAATGLPARRAAAVLDPTTPAGAAAAARVAADEAEAARLRLAGTPAAVASGRVRVGAALLALARRAARGPAAVALVVAAVLALGGCGRTGLFAGLSPKPRATVEVSEALAETTITRIAVLPLAPLAGSPEDAEFVADEIREGLRARELSVATPVELAEAMEAVTGRPTPPGRAELMLDVVRAVALHVGADAVMTGRITRFLEREGTPLAARVPASVEFTVELRRPDDGAVLWRGRYDETQQALSENLADAGTFFRGGGRWLTARELARLGVQELLQRFPVRPGPPGPPPAPLRRN